MPWISLPFQDKRTEELSEYFEVQGIPYFVVIDPATGKNITTQGRSAVTEDPTGAEFPWHPKPLASIESAIESINTSPSLFYNDSNLTPETTAILNKVATSNWDHWKAEGKEPQLHFFYGKNGDLAKRVLEFTSVTAEPALIILDIPSGRKYVGTISEPFEESLRTFVDSWKAGSLSPVSLRS